MPAFFRHDLGFGTSDDVSGLIAYLASDEAASVSGQAIGVGGDRLQLWSHPEPVVTAYHDGGWSYEALRAEFAAGQRHATLHVGFCPPLASAPTVEADPADGPDATVRAMPTRRRRP